MRTSNFADLLNMGKFASRYLWCLLKFSVGKTKNPPVLMFSCSFVMICLSFVCHNYFTGSLLLEQ